MIFEGHSGWVNAIIFKDELMFSAGDDKQLIVWDLKT
jgi:WD40 repeat protein